MAPRSRFSPVKFYPGGGGSAARRAAPLTGQTMRIDRYKPEEMPPGAGAQTVQALAKVAAAFIEGERDKKDRAAERADQATTVEMMKALRAPQTPFDPAKYGTSPEELRAAAFVMPEGEEDDAWPVPSSEDQRGFYTDAAKRTQTAYDKGDPHGADLVIKRHEAGDYNIKDTRDWWDKFIGEDKPEGLAPGSRDLMTRILLGDKEKKDAEKLLASKREYERSVAEALTKSKIEAAQAKPGTDPTSHKEWRLSGSKLSFEQWLEKRDYAKMGLRPPGSRQQPTPIPGGPADIKQQRVKLQETSNELMRRKVELMEQKIDPDYIAKIEEIRKSAGYLIDLRKSRPKARGAVNTLKMKGEKVAAIVADALPLAKSLWSAGPGSAFSSVWNTNSRKLAGLLTNLRAIIGFDTLAEMRANSPTGGALGQVSNIEINLLQAVQGTLDQGQQELLIRSLTDIQGNYPRLLAWAEERFKEQYAPLEKQGQNLIKRYGLTPPGTGEE
jgi:hypothetical protein